MYFNALIFERDMFLINRVCVHNVTKGRIVFYFFIYDIYFI